MLDVHTLERRWLKFKIKSYLPHTAVAITLLCLIITTIMWYTRENESTIPLPPKPLKTSVPEAKKAILPVQHESTILEPSMEFVRTLSESSQEMVSLSVSQEVAQPLKPLSKSAAITPPPPVTKTFSPMELPSISPKAVASSASAKGFSINRNESALDITELERRFRETSNANLGLFIARHYYERAEYSEAYNYALKTNAINSRIDESWIIFSKSLMKLGKKDQAKKTLQLYHSQSNSEAAKALLDAIEKGQFQ